jgi:hypothetical protein
LVTPTTICSICAADHEIVQDSLEEYALRNLVMAAAIAISAVIVTAGSAPAMSAAPGVATGSRLAQEISYGCGRGFHPNPRGRCVPSGGYGYGDAYGWRSDRGREYGRENYDQPEYGRSIGMVPRQGCPRGQHPGNSGRCVNNF